MRYRPFAAAALLLALAITGCSVTGQAERAVEGELPRLVGPAQSYQVHIQGLRGTSGADLVQATGLRVQPKGSPVLDRVDVALHGVTYDRSRRRIERVEGADIQAAARAADIATFLDTYPRLSGVVVELAPPDVATIRTRVAIPELSLPSGAEVTTRGRVVGEGPRVSYVIDQVTAGGIPLPGEAARILSNAINPLDDLSGMPVVPQVTGVNVQGDALLVKAVGSYPAR